MRIRIKKSFLFVAALPLLGVLLFTPQISLAEEPKAVEGKVSGAAGDAAASGDAAAAPCGASDPSAPTQTLSDPFCGASIQILLGRAIQIITGVSGSLALLMFVYGGFTWVTSQGSSDKIKKGKQIFTTATLGLIIIFGSYALLTIVFKALSGGAL